MLNLVALGSWTSCSFVGEGGEGSEIRDPHPLLVISGFSHLESCYARFNHLPLFACTTTGILALMLRANLVVGLSTSSACHLVDCEVVVVSCFSSSCLQSSCRGDCNGPCELTCVSCILSLRASASSQLVYFCIQMHRVQQNRRPMRRKKTSDET